MALIRSIHPLTHSRVAKRHTDVNCTYTIVVDDQGRRCIQFDTYGSDERQERGKKSQALRLTPEAVAELQAILDQHFPPEPAG